MRSGRARKTSSVLIMFSMISIIIHGFTVASPWDNSADLIVEELSATPTQNGFLIHVSIKNSGDITASRSTALLMGKELGNMSDPAIISKISMGNIPKGQSFEKDITWIPTMPGSHLLYLTLDVDGDVKEASEDNNLRLLAVSLPNVESVRSNFDGLIEVDRVGKFINGIPNEIDIQIDHGDVASGSLLRTYLQINNGTKVYASSNGGGKMIASLDPSYLHPGEHLMFINSSYAGVPLPSKEKKIVMVPQPNWTLNLTSREMFFDQELNCYSISGRVDIPSFSYIPDLEVGELREPIEVGSQNDEVLLRSFILADGTTTLDSEMDLRIQLKEQKFTLSTGGRIFSSSPEVPGSSEQDADARISMDLGGVLPVEGIEISGPYGTKDRAPFDPVLHGDVTCDVLLSMGKGDRPIDIGIDLEMVLSGSGVRLHSYHAYGTDDPLIRTEYNISILSDLALSNGIWSVEEEITSSFDATYSDLGLSDINGGASIREPVRDSDIEIDEDGQYGTLEISPKEGSMNKLIFQRGEQEIEVYRNNTYISHPCLTFHDDGTVLVVWTEASYDEDPRSRASTLDLRTAILATDGNGSFQVDEPFGPGPMDHQPETTSLTGSNITALCWVRDVDSDPMTINDTEIMLSIHDSSQWSEPVRLTDDEIPDSSPRVAFAEDGSLWVVWRSGEDRIRFRMKGSSRQWTEVADIPLPDGTDLTDLSLVGQKGDGPLLIYGLNYADGLKELNRRTGNPSRDSYWDENISIHSTMNWIEDPSISVRNNGMASLVWREFGNHGSDLMAMAFDASSSDDGGTSPIMVTNNDLFQTGTSHLHIEQGEYLFSYRELNGSMMELDPMDEGNFRVLNLSWGADIERVSIDPGFGQSPGSMVKATVTLEYKGLATPGSTRVDLYRTSLDRSTGEVVEEFWASEIVDFEHLSESKQIEFTVTVKEYQLGLSILSVVPKGVGPEFESVEFRSVPAVPDPEISDIRAIETVDDQLEIEVDVHNWGSVSVGGWEMWIVGYSNINLMILPDSIFEPLFIRDRQFGNYLNSTRVFLDPGETRKYRLNATLDTGLNHFWIEMGSGNWEPGISSYDEIVYFTSPDIVIEGPDNLEPCLEDQVNEIIYRIGSSYPFGTSIYSLHNEVIVSIDIIDSEGSTIYNDTTNTSLVKTNSGGGIKIVPLEFLRITNTSIKDNESMVRFDLSNISMKPGEYSVIVSVFDPYQDHRTGISTIQTISSLKILSRQSARIKDIGEDRSGSQRGIRIVINNTAPSNIDIYRITLYNGLPEDDVIISEAIGLDLTSGQEDIIILYEDLSEGTYLLSLVISVPDQCTEGNRIEWIEMDRYVEELEIAAIKEDVDIDEKEVEWSDVSNSLIISISAVMVVLLVSSLLYSRKDGSD